MTREDQAARMDGRRDGHRRLSRTSRPPAEFGTFADEVHAALKGEILSGAARPGERLRETDVGSRFGVSRTPVREAFLRLVSEGLLRRDGSGGLAVSTTTTSEIVDIYVIREALEGTAAGLAAVRATDNDFLMLELAIERTDEAMAQGKDELALALSNEFHTTLWQVADNARLSRLLSELNASLQRFAKLVPQYPKGIRPTFDDHHALLEAIRQGDAALAEQTARTHMRRVKEMRIELLLRQTTPALSGISQVGE